MAQFDLSIFSGTTSAETQGSELAEVLERALSAIDSESGWQVTADGFWTSVNPPPHAMRAQGWKLHLSATPAAAETVLARVLPFLLDGNFAFKFASTVDHVAQLNARHTPRGHSGKFITIYPSSDDEAVRIAEALHQATIGLPGPRILSDRPYAPGSLVHYRYGAFIEERRLGNDGLYAWVIFDPDGNPVEDVRAGQYLPPAWAACPFPEHQSGSATPRRDGGILLADRFLVREAIRHVNKGSVYRAVDAETGAQVIIKEARPHVGAEASGRDVRDLLRAEARALERIGSAGAGPRLIQLFEQGGHLFLAEELVPGVTLREWVLDRIRGGGWRRQIPNAVEMAERLANLLNIAHQAGLVLRDFTPNNVMVLPDDELRLIDLELAVVAGEDEEELTGSGTLGYAAPEQMASARATIEADYYSLGASLCFVLTGATPDLMPETPAGRPERDRLAEWLDVRGAVELPPKLPPLILGLMESEPERRLTTAHAVRVLAAIREVGERAAVGAPAAEASLGRLTDEQWHDTVDGIVRYLLASMNPTHGERLWPVSCAEGTPDPCIVQLGAAGVLGVLTRCFELTGDNRLPEAIATTGRWIAARLDVDATRPPGLYFGEAGIAWSLYEAGRVLDDDRLTERGLSLAAALPVSSPNPDVTHGTAGIGIARLHFALRTDDSDHLRAAGESADTLLASAATGADGLLWATPAAFESRFAGGRYYGFSHGTAGVGYFLLAVGLATGRANCLELARSAGETLLDTATVSDGVALWGTGPGEDTTAPYWCHGSSGIGSFLTRLHRATGDDRFDKLAAMSACAVMENSWRGVLGQCHGHAGNGEFLLDMATGEDGKRYEASAHQVARVLFASRARQNGWVVFPNEEGAVSTMWADGLSGILSFLLRLRYGSSRLWMADSVFERISSP